MENRTSILKETIHNLSKSTKTGSLWLLDNESSFLSSYSMLYGINSNNAFKFRSFHQDMLKTTCLFRKKTTQRLFAILKNPKPSDLLLRFINDNEPIFRFLPKIHEDSLFVKHFEERLNDVWQWIKQCQMDVGVDQY